VVSSSAQDGSNGGGGGRRGCRHACERWGARGEEKWQGRDPAAFIDKDACYGGEKRRSRVPSEQHMGPEAVWHERRRGAQAGTAAAGGRHDARVAHMWEQLWLRGGGVR
jgi:hypothetical protein